MSAITAKARRKMKKYAVLTREPRCFLGSFDFSWEQRKLGEIGSVSMCRRIFKEQTSETGDIPFYKIGTFGADPDAFISRELFEEYKSKYPYPQKGDILISASGSIGRTVEFAGNNEYFQDSNIVWLNHDERLSNPFLKCFYSVVKWAGIEGSTIKRLYNDNILNTVICMPSVPEQKCIGLFFENLDNLITLHQRKCVFLFSFFRACISMNFTASTFSWEQRKFSELVQIERGGSPRPIDDFITDAPNGLNWVKIGDAPTQGNYITKTAEKIRPEGLSKTREVHPGDLILSNSMSFGKPYIMGIDGCIHDGWLLIRNTYGVFDLTFLCHLLGTPQMLSQYRSLAAGSTVNNLNKELVGNTYVTIPSITEQRVLGAYLEQLDNLITLHQRQHFLHSTPDISLSVRLIHPFYTSSWEQRKAIDIADYSKGNGYSKGDLTDAGTPIILYGRLYTKYQFAISEVDTFAFPRNGAVYSQGNEVIVPASGETAEDIARASAVEKSGVLLGGDLNILRPFDFINPLFLALAISNGEPQKELAKKAQGKSVVHIHNTDIQEVTIAYPSRTEQDRIVSVFRQLDNLITLHQRKGKAAVSGCSNDANNSKGVCCKARDFGYKCHKKDEPNRFDA